MNRVLLKLLAGATALGLGPIGCATTPSAPTRTTVAAGLAERGAVGPGELSAPREWTAPPGVSIGDALSINDAVAIALWNNADFQAALSGLGLARADLVDAGLIRNPILSLLFPVGPKQLEWTLSWPVDVLWQRPRRIAEARINADAVAQQLVAHGLRLIADVKLAVVEILAAERTSALAAEQTQLARQISDLAAGRLRAGDISDFEARLARTDAARLEARRLARTSARDLALARLRALLGLGPDAPAVRLADPGDAATASCVSLPELVKGALASRPDIRAAELQIDAAGARAGLERAKILALTAVLDANAEGREGFEMGPGLGIELPIFSQNQGRRTRAVAEIEQASRRYLAVRASVVAAVERAFIQLRDAVAADRLLGEAIGTSLAIERQQAQRLYEAGEISLLSLLETRQRLIDVEEARLDAGTAARRAVVVLEEAIGRNCGAR